MGGWAAAGVDARRRPAGRHAGEPPHQPLPNKTGTQNKSSPSPTRHIELDHVQEGAQVLQALRQVGRVLKLHIHLQRGGKQHV